MKKKKKKKVKDGLDKLLDKITEENKHGETCLGPPVGKEDW